MNNVITEYVGKTAESQNISSRWWLVDKDVHNHAFAVAQRIDKDSSFRRNMNLRYARLYANRELMGLGVGLYAKASQVGQARGVTLNIIKSCVDAAAAKIASARPRPRFLTSGGDWKLQAKAKKLTKFMDGLFAAHNVYEVGQRCFVDSGVFGTGAMKVFGQNGQPCFERVLVDELLVDDSEGFYGEPRQMHQRKYIPRDVLLESFGKDEALAHEIKAATAGGKDVALDKAADLIQVIESWHLRSGPEAKDGRHCISIANATLLNEPYEKDRFPFVFLRWSPALVGFWGTGIAEEITGIQVEINKILRNIQNAMHLTAFPRVFVENGSMLNTDALNTFGGIVKYTGQRPQFDSPIAMNAETYQHLERLKNYAYEIVGISQLSASSKKPAGLESGRALRDFQDIESERFIIAGQRYEQFYMDAADLAIDVMADLYEENPKLAVKVAGKGFIEEIPWKDVNMKRDQYVMRVFPTSILPTLPAGRLEAVQDLIEGQFITREEGVALLDFPDLESVVSLTTAAYEDVMQLLQKIVEDGEYESPEPYMNLALCVKLGQSMYLKAKQQNTPEERLELLRRFIDDADAMAKQKMEAEQPLAPVATAPAPMDPMAAMPPMDPAMGLPGLDVAPMAAPEALPPTDLLPPV
jgi:hypothetical protein